MVHVLPSETFDTCTSGTLMCFAQWASAVTQGMFWVFALFGFCVAIFMATARLGSNRAFAFASFVAIMGSMWFAVMGLMTWWLASAFILVGLGGLVAMINSKK